MSFPWDTLITAGFTVGGTLGGAWLKGRQDSNREQRQAKQAAEAAQGQRQQTAYAELVVTARQALRNLRQLRLAHAADTPDEPEVREAFSQSGHLADELNKAVAVVEIVGTEQARAAAGAVYDSAKEVGDFYQARSLTMAAVERDIGLPRGRGLVSFDAEKARTLCDALSDAIDNFVAAVRPQPAVAGRAKPRDTPRNQD